VTSPRAQSFGRVAELYDAYRPSPPLGAAVPLAFLAGADVVEVGAGTGLVTRFLTSLGAHVTAVEPDDEMRAVLTRRSPDVPALAAVAESLPFDDETFDAVLASSAWHWFEQPAALLEFARVLRDGGRLVVLGNGPNRFNDLVRRLVSARDELAQRSGTVHGPPDISVVSDFDSPSSFDVEWEWDRTSDDLVGLFRTYSGTIALEESEQMAVDDRVRAFVAEIAPTGVLRVPMRLRGWVAQRRLRG
jgi:SAM-dependent methyltransferase